MEHFPVRKLRKAKKAAALRRRNKPLTAAHGSATSVAGRGTTAMKLRDRTLSAIKLAAGLIALLAIAVLTLWRAGLIHLA